MDFPHHEGAGDSNPYLLDSDEEEQLDMLAQEGAEAFYRLFPRRAVSCTRSTHAGHLLPENEMVGAEPPEQILDDHVQEEVQAEAQPEVPEQPQPHAQAQGQAQDEAQGHYRARSKSV